MNRSRKILPSIAVGILLLYLMVTMATDIVTEAWLARYNGPANGRDGANDVAVDSSGNVYVTGASMGDGTNCDYATVKYDTDGNELWVARYNGPADAEDTALSIAVDSSGNAYVAGRSVAFNGWYDYATVKYDPNGEELWVARYNGPGDSRDTGWAIALDSLGNAHVTGWSVGLDGDYDFATVKYDTNGNELWVSRYEDGSSAMAIGVDDLGNVYVTGPARDGINVDYATVKYDTNGNELWVARYDGPTSGGDHPYAMAVDSPGNVYVTGRSRDGLNRDYATVKYDTNGNELWVARYDGPTSGSDTATAAATDAWGNVWVTGLSDGIATIGYDAAGNEIWVARSEGSAHGIAVDHFGDVFVTGESAGDYLTVKYIGAGPSRSIEVLIETIEEMDLDQGMENGLVSKLENAVDSLEKENSNASIGQLEAFINSVEAQRGKKLMDDEADYLIARAQDIIGTI